MVVWRVPPLNPRLAMSVWEQSSNHSLTSWSHQSSLLGSDDCDTLLGVKPEESPPLTLAVRESSHSPNLEFPATCTQIGCHFVPTGWAPWSSADYEEDLWSMRCSCTMGLWPTGSVPDKRLVMWTLSRLVPMNISVPRGGGWLEVKLGFGVHPEWYFLS